MNAWPTILGSTVLDDGSIVYYGRQLMVCYPGSEHTRAAEFRVPALMGTSPIPAEGQSAPVVHATVYTIEGNVGTMFAVYQIDHAYLGSDSQFVVAAQNPNLGQKVDNDFYCSITIIGKPIPKP